MSSMGRSAMSLIASITSVSKPVIVGAVRMLSSTSVATTSTSGITSRMKLRNHHRSVRCNLKAHGLSGSGGMTK